MNKFFFLFVAAFLLISCGAKKTTTVGTNGPDILSTSTNGYSTSEDFEPFLDVTRDAPDDNYGLSGENPVMVGEKSSVNQRRYLASLAGPYGEQLTFHRRGSCCSYESENGMDGVGLVDVYEVSYGNIKQPILVYISFYDSETLYIPRGFTKRNL
ncbi:hypothetical protein [Ulvibacter antarcticus]|uniref:2-dehydro-3-deoxyphosphooctonate aldolase n=1 Tax=Ulvibacter antarcticus TaxID=442714 RepID=A0A3L9YBD6_9FLAO|nr:hypothetical protein [Ulvibacter antarcticus]RMA58043.1 hypothetical protein BXY75_2851 [Ulvibacter antarcticus]